MRGSVQQVRDESGALDPHVFEIGGFASAAQPAPSAPQEPARTELQYDIVTVPARAAAVTRQPEKPLTARQLLSQLRARLRVVEREIKARQALEVERAQIQRLIAAAKTERNNVRAIRAAG